MSKTPVADTSRALNSEPKVKAKHYLKAVFQNLALQITFFTVLSYSLCYYVGLVGWNVISNFASEIPLHFITLPVIGAFIIWFGMLFVHLIIATIIGIKDMIFVEIKEQAIKNSKKDLK